MKPIQVLSALGLAVALAAGCQEMTSTTSTGPSEGNGEAAVKKLTEHVRASGLSPDVFPELDHPAE